MPVLRFHALSLPSCGKYEELLDSLQHKCWKVMFRKAMWQHAESSKIEQCKKSQHAIKTSIDEIGRWSVIHRQVVLEWYFHIGRMPPEEQAFKVAVFGSKHESSLNALRVPDGNGSTKINRRKRLGQPLRMCENLVKKSKRRM